MTVWEQAVSLADRAAAVGKAGRVIPHDEMRSSDFARDIRRESTTVSDATIADECNPPDRVTLVINTAFDCISFVNLIVIYTHQRIHFRMSAYWSSSKVRRCQIC